MDNTLRKMLMSAMGSVISHVDTREKILEVIEPLMDTEIEEKENLIKKLQSLYTEKYIENKTLKEELQRNYDNENHKEHVEHDRE